jgi:hypothetical protein
MGHPAHPLFVERRCIVYHRRRPCRLTEAIRGWEAKASGKPVSSRGRRLKRNQVNCILLGFCAGSPLPVGCVDLKSVLSEYVDSDSAVEFTLDYFRPDRAH